MYPSSVLFICIEFALVLQEDRAFRFMHLLHSALVACSLHLLTGFISRQFQDIANVLLAHPQVQVHLYLLL